MQRPLLRIVKPDVRRRGVWSQEQFGEVMVPGRGAMEWITGDRNEVRFTSCRHKVRRKVGPYHPKTGWRISGIAVIPRAPVSRLGGMGRGNFFLNNMKLALELCTNWRNGSQPLTAWRIGSFNCFHQIWEKTQ